MVTVEGVVEEIIFSNEINGYTVCFVKGEKDVITVVGYLPFISCGESVKIIGNWVTHPDYGEQLKAEGYEKVMPGTADAIEKYLASGVIKGIGPATACKIVEKFKEETMEIIQFRPEMLAEIKGISFDKAMKIGQAFEEQRDLSRVIMFFQEYGINTNLAMKIYKNFGNKTIDEIKSNPYKLADEIFGIGFKTADKIAKSMGVDQASRFRICSGIKYVLAKAASNGHSFIPDYELKDQASALLEVNIDNINDSLVSLIFEKTICVEKENDFSKVYLSPFYYAEIGVCRKLAEISDVSFDVDLNNFEEIINEVQNEEKIFLADNQKSAIRESIVNGVLIITGGPGTGKTTIIKSIIKLLSNEGFDVTLAAPTGRAAKRMTETTGFEARTLHRLLEIGYSGGDNEPIFNRSEANPIEADVVIIDEMSMVDILIMNHLLKAISPGTRLVLVGDVDQLPSVGAGNVLKDIISSGMLKTVKLTEIFRQAEESMIIVNAHRINKGDKPRLNEKGRDFFFMPRINAEDIVKTVVELSSKRLPCTYGYDPLRDIQVLTPTRKGIVGVTNLNLELQKILNPASEGKNEKEFRGFTFREGDKVMQIKNNYNLKWEKPDSFSEGMGVFNGDTGIIKKIDNEEYKVNVLFEDEKQVEYDFSILDEIEPAFAITIHKSQGSEFKVVILPIYPGPQVLMTRNLLYTSITRAKNLVILVGNENTLYEMVNNEKETLRYSGVSEKLRKCFLGI